jgi:predicted ester cyclase
MRATGPARRLGLRAVGARTPSPEGATLDAARRAPTLPLVPTRCSRRATRGGGTAGTVQPAVCPTPWRRPLPLLVCLLALATGLALLGIGETLTTPTSGGAPGRAADDVALVRRFYARANAVLAGGDPAALNALVAPDFLAHPTPIDGSHGRDGLVRAVLSRRTAFPGLTLVVDDVATTGADRVTARLHAAGGTGGAFLGLPLPAPLASWGPIEVWRVAEGRLVERWGSPDAIALRPLARTAVDVADPQARQTLTVTRLTIDPGVDWPLRAGAEARLVVVKTGHLTVTATPARSATSPPTVPGRAATAGSVPASPVALPFGHPLTLALGDPVLLPPPIAAIVANPGPAPATLLVVALRADAGGPLGTGMMTTDPGVAGPPATGGTTAATPVAAGVVGQVLATTTQVPLPAGAIVGVGRLALAPGTDLPLPAGGAAVLVVVEAGQLALTSLSPAAPATTTRLAPGAAVRLEPRIASDWRSVGAGPAILLVLTVTAGE